MVNWWKYCLSVCLLGFLASGCLRQKPDLYRRSFSPEEQRDLARRLEQSVHYNYYQGSPAEQMILREALRYDSSFADIHRELGVPYLKRGIAPGFWKYYARAADLDPLRWTGWRGYLFLYFYRDYERALDDFNALDTLTPDIVDYPQSQSVDFMRGICYLQLDQYEDAIRFFRKHIAHESELSGGAKYIEPQTFLFLGLAHLGQRDTLQAVQVFERGHELSPENADLLYWLARMDLAAGRREQARRRLEQAKRQLGEGYVNRRAYVEEFYQTYEADLEALGDVLEDSGH